MDIPLLLDILRVVYPLIGSGYAVYLSFVHDKAYPDADMKYWQMMLFAMIMSFIWPVMLVARTIKNRKELNHRKRQLIQKLTERNERIAKQDAIKAKADAAEESWKWIRAENQKKLNTKRLRYRAEHQEWDAIEKQASEEHYRKLNYSGIREARLRARQAGNDGEANMLNRLLEDKYLEAVEDHDFLDTLEPDERQRVIARAEEIKRERWEKEYERTFGNRPHIYYDPYSRRYHGDYKE